MAQLVVEVAGPAADYGRTVYDCYLRRELMTCGEELVDDAERFDVNRSAAQIFEDHTAKLDSVI